MNCRKGIRQPFLRSIVEKLLINFYSFERLIKLENMRNVVKTARSETFLVITFFFFFFEGKKTLFLPGELTFRDGYSFCSNQIVMRFQLLINTAYR